MKKTDQQKQFEKFARKKYPGSFETCGTNNVYFNPFIRFAFECWQESARIEREHAKG
jgi:hypothetical protein